MASQPSAVDDLPELTRRVGELRKAGKLADAVPLAERMAQIVEAPNPAESLEVAAALIELAEMLIAFDRAAEAEPLLQRALGILVRQPGGEAALRGRYSHLDTSRLVEAVAPLRSLLADMRLGGMRFSLDPPGAASRRPSPNRGAMIDHIEEEEEEKPRSGPEVRARSTRPSPIPPPAAPTPAPHAADTKRERVALQRKLARRATESEPEAPPVEIAAAFGDRPAMPEPATPQGALAIEAGRLAYQIPDHMWVGVQETVEVRLGAMIANKIMEDFTGRGGVRLEHVPIVETMKVSLVCLPGAFDIESRSEEAQLVKPDLVKGTAFHQDDFAKWVWLVTPRQRGKHTLFVKVSAAIRDSRGLPTTSSLPDKTITVEVRVHLVRAVAGVFGHVTPLVVSGVVTTLVGIFTKDYWWPYVRDVVWPVVRAAAGMQ
jgi:hypothetical protein